MSFFIRNKSKGPPGGRQAGKRRSRGGGGGDIAVQSKRKKKNYWKKCDEEIESEDEDELVGGGENFEAEREEEDEAGTTAQEKKLQLAKKYLGELKKREEERAQEENEPVDSLVLERLKEAVLERDGKLRRRVADKIKTQIAAADIQVLRCKEHKLSITCVVVSPDSQFAYSASKDGSIVKWNLAEGKKLKFLPPKYKRPENPNLHASAVLALAVSADGKYLASSDEGQLIQLWDAETLDNVFTFKGHRAAVTGLAFVATTLYSCSRDRTVKSWNIVEKGYIETLFGHQSAATSVDVLSPDRVLTSGGADGSIRLWKIPEESHLIFNGGGVDCVRRLDGGHFVSCSDDGSVSVWGVFKKKPLATVRLSHGASAPTGQPNWCVAVAPIDNTEVFASGSNDGFVRLWKCDENFKSISNVVDIPVVGFVNSLAFSRDGKILVAAVGQEHRLGRWSRMAQAKNSILVVNIMKPDLEEKNIGEEKRDGNQLR